MVSVLSSNVINRVFYPKPTNTKLVVAPYRLNMRSKSKYLLESGKCVRVERQVFPRNVVSVSKHYKNPTKRVGQPQNVHHHHCIEM